MCSRWFAAAGLLCLLSCSVKEQREACPCALSIVLENLPGPVSVQVIGGSHQATYHSGGDTVMRVQAPKGKIRLSALCGARLQPNEDLEIPLGYECPPVYLYSELVNTLRDSASVKPQLHKHFCTLSLTFDGPRGWGEPYWAQVRGQVGGMDREGHPAPGDFSCRLDTGFSIRLPRQSPNQELWLDITMPDRVVRSFPLDRYMLEAGFDWTAPDLEDLPLQISLSVTELLLSSGNWKKVIPIKMDI